MVWIRPLLGSVADLIDRNIAALLITSIADLNKDKIELDRQKGG